MVVEETDSIGLPLLSVVDEVFCLRLETSAAAIGPFSFDHELLTVAIGPFSFEVTTLAFKGGTFPFGLILLAATYFTPFPSTLLGYFEVHVSF